MATARSARALRRLQSGRWPNRSIPRCAEALPRDYRDVAVQRRIGAVEAPLDDALDDPLCVLLAAACEPDDGRRHVGRLAVPGAVWATTVIVPAPLARTSAFAFDACRCLGVGLSRPGRGPRRRPCPTPRASVRGTCRPGGRRRWPSRARRRMPDLDARAQPHPLADRVSPRARGSSKPQMIASSWRPEATIGLPRRFCLAPLVPWITGRAGGAPTLGSPPLRVSFAICASASSSLIAGLLASASRASRQRGLLPARADEC